MRVRVNKTYRYDPCMMDVLDPPVGVERGLLNSGDVVRVVNMPCCPKCNTMGHCHIKTLDGVFAGLVNTHSLDVKD